MHRYDSRMLKLCCNLRFVNKTRDGLIITEKGTTVRVRAPDIGSIHRGVVKRTEDYGAFVQLEGEYGDGLVHVKNLFWGDYGKEKRGKDFVESIAPMGAQVFVLVKEVKSKDKHLYQLSIADVDQKTGALVKRERWESLPKRSRSASRPDESRKRFKEPYDIRGQYPIYRASHNPYGPNRPVDDDDDAPRRSRSPREGATARRKERHSEPEADGAQTASGKESDVPPNASPARTQSPAPKVEPETAPEADGETDVATAAVAQVRAKLGLAGSRPK